MVETDYMACYRRNKEYFTTLRKTNTLSVKLHLVHDALKMIHQNRAIADKKKK